MRLDFGHALVLVQCIFRLRVCVESSKQNDNLSKNYFFQVNDVWDGFSSNRFGFLPRIIVVLGLNAIVMVWTKIGLYIQEQFQVIISQLSKKLTCQTSTFVLLKYKYKPTPLTLIYNFKPKVNN